MEFSGNRAVIRNGSIAVVLEARTEPVRKTGYPTRHCALSFLDDAGQILFEEVDQGGALQRIARDHYPNGGGDVHLTASFTPQPGNLSLVWVLVPAPIGTIPEFARDGALQELVGSTAFDSIVFIA
ncbi:hypothetical protein M1D88_07600 [Arthrobacter sp. R1-13]